MGWQQLEWVRESAGPLGPNDPMLTMQQQQHAAAIYGSDRWQHNALWCRIWSTDATTGHANNTDVVTELVFARGPHWSWAWEGMEASFACRVKADYLVQNLSHFSAPNSIIFS